MKKTFSFLPICLLFVLNLFSQDGKKYFEITASTNKVHNSLYNTISFLDSRGDTSMIGMVYLGVLKNIPAKFILKTPVLPQLKNLMNSLIDSSTNGNGELLLQLKQFNFVETSGSRYCFLSASTYENNNNQYRRISLLDTIIIITTPNVAKVLQHQANEIISKFIAESLMKKSTETDAYNLHDLDNIDSIDKRKIPVYNTSKYVDGIYTSYFSFKSQVPDMHGIVETKKDGSITSVKITDSSGKKIKLKPKYMYAVVNNGKPFIATEYDYYPLEKMNDNFIFTGDIRIAASSGDIAAGQMALGLTGALIAKAGNREKFVVLLDYVNGAFIHQIRLKNDIDD